MPRVRLGYASVALAVFVTEAAIALWANDRFIRGYVGDALAIVLVYCGLRALTSLRVMPAMTARLLIACAIELSQLFHMIDVLGLRGNSIARTVLGGVWDIADFAAYAVGAALTLFVETGRKSRFR